MDALELDWAFGINSNVANCVHLLQNNEKNEEIIVYPVSNYGVVYNINTKKQTFLSQHTNIITSCILSSDKEFLILGDSGASNNKSIISIWNCRSFELMSTYELPQNFGIKSLAINKENNLLSAIVNESTASKENVAEITITQHLIIWSLTKIETNEADNNPDDDDMTEIQFKLLSQQKIENKMLKNKEISRLSNKIIANQELYHFIVFNHDSTEIVTHGQSMENFIFWKVEKLNENEDAVAMDEEDHTELKLSPYYTQLSLDNINNLDLSNIGHLTQSAFLPFSDGPIITATNNGDLIIWEYDTKKSTKEKLNNISNIIDEQFGTHRIINKIINKITRGSINCVSILNDNDIIVLASSSGSVRFYDFECRVIGWLDYLGDQVISISFPINIPKYGDIKKFKENKFEVPNMIIATKNNKIIKVESAESQQNDENNNIMGAKHKVIIDTFNTICTSMSSHPSLPYIAVGNQKGEIQIWDMMNKTILQNITLPQPLEITDIQFSPNGEWMVFATDSHYLRIYDTEQFAEQQLFKTTYDGNINNLCFSFNGEWMAFSQKNRISVYRFWHSINDIKKEKPKEWVLIGNYISHNKPIICIHFAPPSGIDNIQQRNIPRLFSVGHDNLINEYNLNRSSFNFGLRLKYTFHLTQMSSPTFLQFIPGIELNKENLMTYSLENDVEDVIAPKYDENAKEWKYTEDLLIVFDDELKLHFYHSPRALLSNDNRQLHTSDTQTLNSNKKTDDDEENQDENQEEEKEEEPLKFRRTVLGPSYGAPIRKLIQMENGKTFVFCTFDQVIGLMESPFNGNPHRYFGCHGHPGRINGFELTMNGKYLITNGGYDKSMLIWKINDEILSQQIIDCDEVNNLSTIYRDILYAENVEENDLYEEIKNYFYYAQIENQGTISTVPRTISGKINIKQITALFQAMGCFFTQSDIERIRKETVYRFGNNNINNNNSVHVDLDQFIELYVNHRSTFEISLEALHESFLNIIGIEQNKEKQDGNRPRIQNISMTRDFFLDILQRKGDKMSRDEMMTCFETLTGYQRKQLQNIMPTEIDAQFFTQNILGLQKENQ